MPDPELLGHYVRVAPTGAKTFWAVARDPDGKQIWTKLGPADVLSIDDARDQARDVLMRVRAGLPAFDRPQVKPASFRSVAEMYLRRHVEANGLRSRAEIARRLAKYVLPVWADRGLCRASGAAMSPLCSTTFRIITVRAKRTPFSQASGVRKLVFYAARRICVPVHTRHEAHRPEVRKRARNPRRR